MLWSAGFKKRTPQKSLWVFSGGFPQVHMDMQPTCCL